MNNKILLISEQVCPCDKIKQMNDISPVMSQVVTSVLIAKDCFIIITIVSAIRMTEWDKLKT